VDDNPWAGEAKPARKDPKQAEAVDGLRLFFESNRDQVFFSRQLEVLNELEWFHWITSRALRQLASEGLLADEFRTLATGAKIHLLWHRANRYYKTKAKQLVSLVNQYADPNIGAALGLHGEALVLEGFAKREFLMKGRNTSSFQNRTWKDTAHDLDFIFERDGLAYGIEVKNSLSYMDFDELRIKIELCGHLGLRPVFAVRMLPKSWVKLVVDSGGFALILQYQLYPWYHRNLAQRVREELGLPVDSPRALEDGTVGRFVRWHERQLV
jgi:hypothetical protein